MLGLLGMAGSAIVMTIAMALLVGLSSTNTSFKISSQLEAAITLKS